MSEPAAEAVDYRTSIRAKQGAKPAFETGTQSGKRSGAKRAEYAPADTFTSRPDQPRSAKPAAPGSAKGSAKRAEQRSEKRADLLPDQGFGRRVGLAPRQEPDFKAGPVEKKRASSRSAANVDAAPAKFVPVESVPEAEADAPPADVVGANAVRHVLVGPNDSGQRLDNFLLKRMPGVPRSHVYQLLRSGQVRVDGGRSKPDRKLVEGEEVRVPPVRVIERDTPPRAPDALMNRLREAIIYEDEHYLAVCKPAGLAAHGGTGVPYGVIEVARSWNRYDFLELVHRLDRDTSGVLLLAKTREGLLRAQRALRDGNAIKRYFALLAGRLSGGPYDVDAALVARRLRGGERYVEVDDEDGKPSQSRFTVSANYHDATLCEVEIFSGRTHQIRVHALALGAPVAGDRKYGLRDDQQKLRDRGLRRMFLHSHFLQLPAEGEFPKLILTAPLVDELREFLDRLRS